MTSDLNSADTAAFDLDVTLVEVADSSQVYNTDDGCGSTCGACASGSR